MPVNASCGARIDHDVFVATAAALGELAEHLQRLLACNDLLMAHGLQSSGQDLRPMLMRAISVLTRAVSELLRFTVALANKGEEGQ